MPGAISWTDKGRRRPPAFVDDPELWLIAPVVVCAGMAIVLSLAPLVGWPGATFLGVLLSVPGMIAPDPVLPISMAVIAFVARRWVFNGQVGKEQFRGFLPPLTLIALGYGVYSFGRVHFEPGRSEAVTNAREVIDLERSLGMFFEASVQEFFARGIFTELFNAIYLFGYWPLPIVALFVFYLRDRNGYRILRNALVISALMALVTYALYPVAPPRLMPGLGIEDTIEHGRVVSNQFAAVPSLHAGWPTLVGFMVFVRATGWIRYAALVPGPLMVLTIIVTGNHYWLDAVIGITYALVPAVYLLALDQQVGGRESPDTRVRV